MLLRENDKIYRYTNDHWVLCGIVTKGEFRKEIKDELGRVLAVQIGEKIEWTN